MNKNRTVWHTLLLLLVSAFPAAAQKPPAQQSPTGITHSFLATGGETYIMSGDCKITWRFPGPSRDGWVLPSGEVLLAAAKSRDYPNGAILRLDKEAKVLFEFKGLRRVCQERDEPQCIGDFRSYRPVCHLSLSALN